MILVAGATGLIGRALISSLQHGPEEYIGVYLRNRHVAKLMQGTFTQADLRNMDACDKLLRNIDTLYLCAGVSGNSIFRANSRVSVSETLLINSNLLTSALTNRVRRVIFFSSATVYGSSQPPFKETDTHLHAPGRNHTIFGYMYLYLEALAEKIVEQSKGSTSVLILRLSSVYGPGDRFDPSAGNVIPSLIAKIRGTREELLIMGNGMSRRDFIFSEDIPEIVEIFASNVKPFEIFNIGSGKSYSIAELVPIIISGFNRHDVRWSFEVDEIGDIAIDRSVSIEKFRARCESFNFTTLEIGVRKSINWFLENIDTRTGADRF